MAVINSSNNSHVAQVSKEGFLLVGLDGFTLEDLANLYPDLRIALHVKDGDKWVPIELDQIKI